MNSYTTKIFQALYKYMTSVFYLMSAAADAFHQFIMHRS